MSRSHLLNHTPHITLTYHNITPTDTQTHTPVKTRTDVALVPSGEHRRTLTLLRVERGLFDVSGVKVVRVST